MCVRRRALTCVCSRARAVCAGVVLVPEGLVDFIPEMGALISELNEVIATHPAGHTTPKVSSTDFD
eukprot:9476010-Pyramimonas_sp.AAC.1